MLDMSADELGAFVKTNTLVGRKILTAARQFPRLEIEATVQPITRTVLKVQLSTNKGRCFTEKLLFSRHIIDSFDCGFQLARQDSQHCRALLDLG